MTALCPRCRHVLDVYPDEEACDHCGYVNRMDFYEEPPPPTRKMRARDDDGYPEGASTFVRDLDFMRERFPE